MPLILRTTVGRTTPLSNDEMDGNFTYLESYTATKLNTTDFNYSNIRTTLNAAPTSGGNRGYESGIDVRYLQGYEPNIGLPAGTNKSSVVIRDNNGDFTARYITASSFEGKSTTSGTADQAVKLQTARKINDVDFDGTAAITIYDKTKLPVTTQFAASAVTVGVTYIIDEVGSTNWVAMGATANSAGLVFYCNAVGTGTGKCSVVMLDKLNLAASTTSRASIRLNHGTAPTTPLNGDIWTTTSGQFNRINGTTRTVAYLDSSITGTASNVTGVVAIANGGTGKTTVAESRAALDAAKRGANSDITSITGLTTALATSQGGTGMGSPGSSGNILISNGTTWDTAKPSGTWDISISGVAATSSKAVSSDTRNDSTTPQTLTSPGVIFDFKKNTSNGLDDGGTYFGLMTFRKYGTNTDWTGGKSHQLGFTDNNNLHIRSGTQTTWGSWHKVLTSNNYNDYAPTKTGGGASGSWGISITGSAASAASAGSVAWSNVTGKPTNFLYNDSSTAYNINITGSAGSANSATTAGSTELLAAKSAYYSGSGWLPNDYLLGVTASFVGPESSQGSWSSYGSVLNVRTYSGGGGSLQLYVPYSPTYGGTGLKVRFGNYDTTNGNSWTAWKTLIASDNIGDYAPSKTGGGASGSWGISITGSAGSAATATKWAGAKKYVQTSEPTDASEGDIWFKV